METDSHELVQLALDNQFVMRVKKPLIKACSRGKVDTVKLLLPRTASINFAECEGPLYQAARWDHRAVIDASMEHGGDTNGTREAKYSNLLSGATNSGDAAMVRYVLQKAPDVQFHTHMEDALEDAAVKGFQDVIRVLLEAGVKVQNLLNSTYNPAMIAVLRGLVKEHMVRVLRKIYGI